MTTTGRRARFFRRDEREFDDEAADLSEDEHAWWAAREKVAGVPTGHGPEAPPTEAARAQYSDYWTPESLFEGQAPPTTDQPDPTPADAPDEDELDLPAGMDLDSAHLVLQVEVGVDWEDITKAHRRLAMQYHPDRLVAYSPAAQELGRVRMAEINAAHSTLRSLHHHT